MKRKQIERLREIFDTAFGVLRAEWDFGAFTHENDKSEKEAEEIFTQLLTEAEE